jgi:hypothetical protein
MSVGPRAVRGTRRKRSGRRADRYVDPAAVIGWAIDLANTDLATVDRKCRLRLTDEMLLIVQYPSRADASMPALELLRDEIRSILSDLASGDPWAPEAAQRRGAPACAHTARELAVSFQWWRNGDGVVEQIYPHDVRSGILLRLRDAIMHRARHFRVRACLRCFRFFVPVKRQLACSRECASRVREARRNPEQRRASKRQAYATRKRLAFSRARIPSVGKPVTMKPSR